VTQRATLDREQLRDVTLDDPELMRDILRSLVDDTASNIESIASAIRMQDSRQCKRLAHYSKGACANVGAHAAADLLLHIEQQAAGSRFAECEASLAALAQEVERLREEAVG
jgi:HPt (histidine-containing phosphotransfer) domain-containing protein